MENRLSLSGTVVISAILPLTALSAGPQGGASQPAAATKSGNSAAKPMSNNTAIEAGQLLQRTNGSLLQATLATQSDPSQAKLEQVSLFAVPEPEAHKLKKHDLVTIIIHEESAISSVANKDVKKEADFSAKLDQFIKINLAKFAIQGLTPNNTSPADIDINGIREFKGNGEMDRSDNMTARITAEVLDVKPNGTLILQARKHIKTDEEEQQFVLTGNCRVEDIAADNTILSTQLYDLDLQKNHKGDVRGAVKRGLLPKLLDLLNPF